MPSSPPCPSLKTREHTTTAQHYCIKLQHWRISGCPGAALTFFTCLAATPACCSIPTVRAEAVSAVEGKAFVIPPTANGPWSRYELTVCVKDASTATCRVLECTASTDPSATTECRLPGCDASVTYTVTAVATKDGLTSQAAFPAEFTTPPHG